MELIKVYVCHLKTCVVSFCTLFLSLAFFFFFCRPVYQSFWPGQWLFSPSLSEGHRWYLLWEDASFPEWSEVTEPIGVWCTSTACSLPQEVINFIGVCRSRTTRSWSYDSQYLYRQPWLHTRANTHTNPCWGPPSTHAKMVIIIQYQRQTSLPSAAVLIKSYSNRLHTPGCCVNCICYCFSLLCVIFSPFRPCLNCTDKPVFWGKKMLNMFS